MTIFTYGHALLVGVGADLPNTVDDAQGLAAILRDPARCAYPPGQVQAITGADATRDRILAALDHLAQTADATATVIVYFSGHGYRVTSTMGAAYYLMPAGYDMERLYQTAVSGSEFAQRLRAISARKLVLLLDCCHAGGVGAAKGLELTKAPLPPEAQHLLAEGRGRVLIASSRADELSYAGKPYSAFTLALIEALCGVGAATRDGYVRVADLALHAREVVPGRTQDKQHPLLHFEQADNFALAYYAGGDLQPKAPPFTVAPQIEPAPGAWAQPGVQQIIHNHAANEGAQGVFHGPVNFTRQEVSGAGAVSITGNVANNPITTGSGNTIIQSGHDTIQAGGHAIQTRGDYVRGDKISTGAISGTGIAIGRGAQAHVQQGGDQDAFTRAFAQIYAAINARRDDPDVDRDELTGAVKAIEQEARKGDAASAKKLARWLHNLATMAEDIFDGTVAALTGPQAAFATVARTVAQRARQEREQE